MLSSYFLHCFLELSCFLQLFPAPGQSLGKVVASKLVAAKHAGHFPELASFSASDWDELVLFSLRISFIMVLCTAPKNLKYCVDPSRDCMPNITVRSLVPHPIIEEKNHGWHICILQYIILRHMYRRWKAKERIKKCES